ncbi:TPA: GNAT family N-acetyltransferase [Morganella morganii]|uniref:GNAT family N-acetyltransferase n=1 Tax=Morganella morganii TaxID=582 RepID=UPI001BD9DE9D|nr:GNAT family N-acetyltransferase [Morganella morganii]MBT0389327.1 GNAT family N-acetyltransferase [Morganella morganii subsp. morganii]HEJ1051805.1 GNAT family N-acetyltransferase [Morganella morganii]
MITLANKISKDRLLSFLHEINDYFSPSLSSKIDIEIYADKIIKNAYIDYIINEEEIIALLAGYINNESIFITLFAVNKLFHGKKISTNLLTYNIEKLKKNNIKKINLEVYKNNKRAIVFYKKFNFEIYKETNDTYLMSLSIC